MASKSAAPVEAEVQGSGGKKKGVLLIVGIAAVTLVLGGGAAWFLLSGKPDAPAQVKTKPQDDHPPIFASLDPFVVNLAGEEEHYLQVGINLKVADAKVTEQIKARLPEVRNAVLLLLSSKHPEELGSLEGKNRLRHEIRAAVNEPLGVRTPPLAVPVVHAEAAASSHGSAVGEAHASDAAAASAGESAAAGAGHAAGDEGVLDVLLTSFVIQ